MEKLVGNDTAKAEGNFVLNNQKTDESFRNVSKKWIDTTISYEEGLVLLEDERSEMKDVKIEISKISTEVFKDEFHLVINDELYKPTGFMLAQLASWVGCGTWFANQLVTPSVLPGGKIEFERDGEDAATLKKVVDNGLRRIKPDKKFLFRIGKNGFCRAMLTDKYLIIDNRWFLDTLSKLIPDGRLSHWRGDIDTVYGNVLIPDSIRAESDSDYGAMISVGNSEIGVRRMSSLPSLFRAICMNGCIWGKIEGVKTSKVHRGKAALETLSKELKENLDKQIPIIPKILDAFMATRLLKFNGDAKTVIAQVCLDNSFSKSSSNLVLESFLVEKLETPEHANSLFSIVNAVTRAGQKLNNENWVKMDLVGGVLSQYDESDWNKLLNKANSLKVKEVEEVFK